jgi:hypothetical protein
MPPVEPTPEYDLAVVTYRPYYNWVRAIIAMLVAILLSVLSYYVGHMRGAETEQSAIVERDRLRTTYAESEKKVKQLEQNVANLKLGSQVDRKATEQVRSRVVELNNKIAELERDNTFYRDLMRPDSDDKGISVGAPTFALSKTGANTYEYKMVVKQQAANRLQVVGYMEFEVVGKGEDGKVQRFDLHQLSQVESLERIKLNFRYFQRLEGSMILPETFTPERIELKVVSYKPMKALIEKQFNWVIKES